MIAHTMASVELKALNLGVNVLYYARQIADSWHQVSGFVVYGCFLVFFIFISIYYELKSFGLWSMSENKYKKI